MKTEHPSFWAPVHDGDAELRSWWAALSSAGADRLARVTITAMLPIDASPADASQSLRLDPDRPWRSPAVMGYAILVGSVLASWSTADPAAPRRSPSIGERGRSLSVRAGIVTAEDAAALESLWVDTLTASQVAAGVVDQVVTRRRLRELLASSPRLIVEEPAPATRDTVPDTPSPRRPQEIRAPILRRLVDRTSRLRIRPLSEALHRRTVRASGLFDDAWYREHNPDVRVAGIDPLAHYVRHGWREGRRPGPAFDSAAYIRRHPDLARTGGDPLLHYLRAGRDTDQPMPADEPTDDAVERS